jgi:hypothetical protein
VTQAVIVVSNNSKYKNKRTKMKTEQKVKLGMSLALATLLSLSVTGCGGGDSAADAVSSAVDVTVERGKVYDANVTDSSTPAQAATQKPGQNVYTFANAPTYPVVVNGGWIDVNDDGKMDASDVKLDIEMKSYTTVVTPVSTYIADVNESVREQKLAELVTKLNEVGTGEATDVTAEDLLKVPSAAPRDVMVISNAIFKDMKEKVTVAPAIADVMSQFNTIDAGLAVGATAVDAEQAVLAVLETTSTVQTVSSQDIFEFEQEQPDAVVPTLAKALLLNNITGLGFLDDYTFNSDYTATYNGFTHRWSVNGTELIVTLQEGGDNFRYVFTNETPVDGETVSQEMFYFDDNNQRIASDSSSSTITVTAPVVAPTPTDPTVTTPTILDLSGYSSIFIYKNTTSSFVTTLTTAFASQNGFTSTTATSGTSCTDYGFSNPSVVSNVKTYLSGDYLHTCSEIDYAGIAGASGTSNALVYYGN